MRLDRLNPVILITGAAGETGAAYARMLAAQAQGGLILIDAEEPALDAAADALQRPPERVSTLAFDIADPARWAQAADFISAHYGRVDFAVLAAGRPAAIDPRLWDPSQPASIDTESMTTTLKALGPLLGRGLQSGVALIAAPAAAIAEAPDEGLLALLRVAAAEAGGAGFSVNALALGPGRAAAARRAQSFADLVGSAGGDEAEALHRLADSAMPLARVEASGVARLAPLFFNNALVSGVTLIVDAPDTH